MLLPKGATVAVADGAKFHLYRNTGEESRPELTAVDHAKTKDHQRADPGHPSSPANPDARQDEEDSFSNGVVDYLNTQVLEGNISALVVIAAPKALGDMRKHYHARLSAVLVGEVAKDLTGHSASDVEKAIAAA